MTNFTESISLPSFGEETINQIVVYGGFCVSTILAMTLFTHVLFNGINDYHRVPKKQNKKINLVYFVFSWITGLIKKLIEKWISK